MTVKYNVINRDGMIIDEVRFKSNISVKRIKTILMLDGYSSDIIIERKH